MKVEESVSLTKLTSMRIGGIAKYVITVENETDVAQAIRFAETEKLPWFVIGGGSNVIAGGDFDGIIILNQIKRFEQIDNVTFKIGSGEIWDETVNRLCELGLSGVEAMSLIPGTVGATPVQNVGAYGQDISQVLVELDAYDVVSRQIVKLSHKQCNLSYRNSIFKSRDNRHYIICDITIKLSKQFMQPPLYPSLAKSLEESHIEDYSPMSIRKYVIKLRVSKLPDPAVLPSAGSFFKNPIIDQKTADKIAHEYPDIPHWEIAPDKVKLSAGWLIDQSGLKGERAHGFQIYPRNALVVTNVGNGNYHGLDVFKNQIIQQVKNKFGIQLEQEPENL